MNKQYTVGVLMSEGNLSKSDIEKIDYTDQVRIINKLMEFKRIKEEWLAQEMKKIKALSI